jgi:ElaB/YqjD/DUF883 family membrane-anchored ribosome-binding protein
MDEWLKQLQDNLNLAAQDSSRWLGEVSKEADQVLDQWAEISQETFQEIQDSLDPALSELNAQIDSTLDASIAFLEQNLTPWIEETTAPLSCTINPWLQNHPTCIGCKNYHGSTYGDSMLVCGMHPYGPEENSCADWESVWETRSES